MHAWLRDNRVSFTTVVAVWLPMSLVSCTGETKRCTLIGCNDQFSATVSAASTAVPAGMHTIDVTVDGTLLSCTFTFPGALPASGGGIVASCQGDLSVDVGSPFTCTTTMTDAAIGQHCEPVPGQIRETIRIAGTPASVHVRQSVDGTVILDQSATPTYQRNQPNGIGCDPICRQAGAEWTIP
jgi:hypothetical protein